MKVIEMKKKKIRIIVPIATISFLVSFAVYFGFSHYDDAAAAKVIEKQGPPEKAATFQPIVQPKKDLEGTAIAHSIQVEKQELAARQLNEKVVYLTFDDGPSADVEKLLNTLDKYGAKATFFMLGPHMKERPEAVKRMVEEGFGVGMHGMTHDPRQFYRSKDSALQEMLDDQKILEQITGVKSHMIRSPYGSIPYFLDSYRAAANLHGLKLWDWNIDSRDWELNSPAYVTHVIRSIELKRSAGEVPVVLLHDRGPTIQYLPKLLAYLKQNGYAMKKIDDSQAPFTFQCNDRCHAYGSSPIKKSKKEDKKSPDDQGGVALSKTTTRFTSLLPCTKEACYEA